MNFLNHQKGSEFLFKQQPPKLNFDEKPNYMDDNSKTILFKLSSLENTILVIFLQN